MTPEHAAFTALTELIRRRLVPGWQRREEERQASFEARYCETSFDNTQPKWNVSFSHVRAVHGSS